MIKRKIKTKNCEHCGKEFTPSNTTQVVCSFNCALEYSKTKAKQKSDKLLSAPTAKKATREEKNSTKTHSDWENALQPLINTIVRLIDKCQPCISCGGTTSPQAGHYHSVGANNSLRFNLHNIHLQDFNCNEAKSANIIGYNQGLIEVYGENYKKYVETEIVRLHPFIKLSIPELREKMTICRQIIKELKLSNKVYNTTERLELRNSLNIRIGIFPISYMC